MTHFPTGSPQQISPSDSMGVLYVAIGERYAEAAATSTKSVRRVMPDIPIAIVTDTAQPEDLFDRKIAIAEPFGYRAKIRGLLATPFTRTLFLDVDTFVARSLDPVFALLASHDMAMAHAPNRVTLPLADVPRAFPEFNTGVMAYRVGPAVMDLPGRWMDEYDRLADVEPPSKDQPSLRRVTYMATDVRVATLPPEYNQRFTMAGYFNETPTLYHGWANPDDHEKVAALAQRALDRARGGAVFFASHVIRGDGRYIGSYRTGPWNLLAQGVQGAAWLRRLPRRALGWIRWRLQRVRARF